MAVIQWDASLSVQNDVLDKQHQKLIDMLNNFYAQIKVKSNNELIANLIREMRLYTATHFRTEEEILQDVAYHDYEAHHAEHEEFLKKVENLEQRFKNGQVIVSFEITSFLKSWLLDHIKEKDQKYAAYIKGK